MRDLASGVVVMALNDKRVQVVTRRIVGGAAAIDLQFLQAPNEQFVTDDPAFGIWRDREDMDDVAAYVRKLRTPRYSRDSSRGNS